ncbi:hypothetical protein Q5P01_005425, partial [Channa striata]
HCAITQRLKMFSYPPPSVLHDLLVEGIVPVELALCLDTLIKRKYFSFRVLNQIIKHSLISGKTVQFVPKVYHQTLLPSKQLVLPLMIGTKVPEQEQAWQLFMTLKDVVELVLSPTHTDESIGHLDSLIAKHRHRFNSVFPERKLIPKHHFVEHYPQLIKAFGPLVSLWTMRFEAKHHFYKRVVRQTCLCNILIVKGTCYCTGMMLVYGSTGGLPDSAGILQIIIFHHSLVFVVKVQSAWYCEHFRCFKLEYTGIVKVVEQSQLTDTYPLSTCTMKGDRVVSLKHHICLSN